MGWAQTTSFPSDDDASSALLALDGNCGPMSVWLACRHLRVRTSTDRVIRLCHHSERAGSYTVALALALHAHGLTVDFRSDVNPAPTPLQRRLYRRAERLGIAVGQPPSVGRLLARVRHGELAIVFFDTAEETGHFSPLIGVRGRRWLILPYTTEGGMDARTFGKRWTAPGICQQCVFVRRPGRRGV